MVENLYVHFPFCRRKCGYCALYSRAGASAPDMTAYVRRLVDEIGSAFGDSPAKLRTVYFGGGSPALCDLSPLVPALRPLCSEKTEFTVELHPLDVCEAKLSQLLRLGANRISMGVQSLDEATLARMGRGYSLADAERAFALVKRRFDNAGIDLIVGYPGDGTGIGTGKRWGVNRLSDWGLTHCSVYSLQNERGLKDVPSDGWMLDGVRSTFACLREMGLERYEISNSAVPGFECRHNCAVWRGEDYLGLGEGAHGRIGLRRTVGRKVGMAESTVSPEEDVKERAIFRLRTRDGLDVTSLSSLPAFPSMVAALDGHVLEGLLTKSGTVYRLTERGTEVCDAILVDLV